DDRSDNTWLSAEMESAYQQLYNKGWAHSIEVYEDNNLIGGVYGPVIPPVFCGESMFSLRDNGSKVALWAISRLSKKLGLSIIDAQIPNPHLESLGAQLIPRQAYLDILHSQNMEKADHWPSGLEYNVQELI
ncbi:MAG: leucyl/phenylalanyl-tRNA--protein transferase, partial [bacterium]